MWRASRTPLSRSEHILLFFQKVQCHVRFLHRIRRAQGYPSPALGRSSETWHRIPVPDRHTPPELVFQQRRKNELDVRSVQAGPRTNKPARFDGRTAQGPSPPEQVLERCGCIHGRAPHDKPNECSVLPSGHDSYVLVILKIPTDPRQVQDNRDPEAWSTCASPDS